MLTAHLEQLGLVCPACRADAPLAVRMGIHVETTAAGDDILEGVLACPACARQHPIVDGVVIAVADLAALGADNLHAALRRHDLSPWIERLLGEASARGDAFERERALLSTVVGAHWGDHQLRAELAPAGSFAHRAMATVAALPSPSGAWLDLGCGAGRATFHLATAGAAIAVGVDRDLALVRRAEQLRRTGVIPWPRRSAEGFEHAVAEVGGLPGDQVAFVCADPAALPFAAATFAGALVLTVADRAPPHPVDDAELLRVLAPAAPLVR